MIKGKRRVSDEGYLEPWLDYHIRSLRTCAKIIDEVGLTVYDKLSSHTSKWAALIANFGQGAKEPHLLKAILAFRCRAWWYEQSLFNDLSWHIIKHAPLLGQPKRWEEQFSSNWWSAFPT